jgi:hypothetical protein
MISHYYATYCSRRALDIRVTLSWMSSFLTRFLDFMVSDLRALALNSHGHPPQR